MNQLAKIEGLEGRRLLSASLKGGVLRGIGDEGVANTITVSLNAEQTQYTVDVNGTVSSYDVQKVRRIILHGSTANDTLTVESSINVRQNLFGYEGNDTLTGGSASDELRVKNQLRRGPRGWTRLWGMGGDDTLIATGGRNFVDGGTGNDHITGSAARDLIAGFMGNDTILAGGGDDIVHGGTGDDVIELGDGNDRALGGDGNDSIKGGDGNDLIFGQAGNDTLDGEAGHDRLYGQLGLDSLLGGDGNDALFGGDDVDVFDGGAGTNRIRQGEGELAEAEEDEAESTQI